MQRSASLLKPKETVVTNEHAGEEHAKLPQAFGQSIQDMKSERRILICPMRPQLISLTTNHTNSLSCKVRKKSNSLDQNQTSAKTQTWKKKCL